MKNMNSDIYTYLYCRYCNSSGRRNEANKKKFYQLRNVEFLPTFLAVADSIPFERYKSMKIQQTKLKMKVKIFTPNQLRADLVQKLIIFIKNICDRSQCLLGT